MCILLVEDEPITLLGARMVLEDAGHDVLAVPHGHAAIEHINDEAITFTILVTDYHLAGDFTGGDVIRHMRPRYPAIPMLLTTAMPHVVGEAFRSDFRIRLLPKPYDLAELVDIVGHMLAA